MRPVPCVHGLLRTLFAPSRTGVWAGRSSLARPFARECMRHGTWTSIRREFGQVSADALEAVQVPLTRGDPEAGHGHHGCGNVESAKGDTPLQRTDQRLTLCHPVTVK